MENIRLKEIEADYEESWQRIVDILSDMLETDVALINSVENDKLEVLQKNNSSDSPFEVNEVYKLADLYCEGVVKEGRMLEINNANKTEEWSDYAGASLGLISYLGYPLFGPDDEVVGTICVEDSRERQFHPGEKKLLKEFKTMIENQLLQMHLTRRLEKSIEKGRNLHSKFLPAELPALQEIDFGVKYRPADRLGGDFYDVMRIDDKILFYVSDVSGHDLSSSLLNIFLKETIKSYLFYRNGGQCLSPSCILQNVNLRFQELNFSADHFIILVIGVLDLNKYTITLSNGGLHVSPFITRRNGHLSVFSCSGFPVAMIGDSRDYEECTREFKPGDTLHLHTDGLIEQKNPSGFRFGEARLRELAGDAAGREVEDTINKIYDEFDDFRETSAIQDDLTSLLIRRK